MDHGWVRVVRIDEEQQAQTIGYLVDMMAASKLIGIYADMDRAEDKHPMYTAETMGDWEPGDDSGQ